MVNDKQKIALLTVDANIKTTIEGYLNLGYVIIMLQYLPTLTKILIVYTTPEVI